MKNELTPRRRGTSVAAAALSFALVAPFVQPVVAPGSASATFAGTPAQAGMPNAKSSGAKYPGLSADGIYQTSVDEERYTFDPGPAKHGAIESGTAQDDTVSIQGFVLNTRNGNMAINSDTTNHKPIPMEGVRVYAQWVDGGYTSPIYTAVTGPDGRYAIKMRSFVDALGGLHEFDADPNLPEGEKIRVWADNPDGETFQQVYGYNNGFLGPQADTIDNQGASTEWLVGPNRVNNIRFFYGEKPQNDVMHKMTDAAENAPISDQGGQVQGKAFWQQDHTQGAFTWNLMNTLNSGDVAAEGLKIYGSYLSDYAINKIKTEAPDAIGVDEIPDGSLGRSPDVGWSRDNEAALQNWIKREMAADTEKDPVTGKFGKDRWIAETVMATVGADNNYTLQFNGTFGEDEKGDRGTGGVARNPLNRNDGTTVAFPDGSEHVAWDLLGTVAPDSNYGTFRKGALGNSSDKMPKHVNWDWLFVSTEDVPGFGVQTPWQTNGYLDVGRYNTNDGWNVAKMPEHLRTSFISLYADYVTFDVTPYDSAENWAKPGDVAETKTNGVPTQFVDNLNYEIEWVNADTGEVVDTSPLLKAGPKGELPSFPLDTGDAELFPDGIDKTTTFRADLYPVDVDEDNARGSRIAADSFTVLVGWAPVYEETEGVPGEPLKSGEPVFDNTTTDEEEKEKGSDLPSPVQSYEIPDTFQVPEGYTVDLNEATGEVTVTFPERAKPGTKIEVPVQVTLEDGTKTTGFADFMVEVEGQYQIVHQGETPDPRNSIKNRGDLPEGTTFEYKDGAPDTFFPGPQEVTVVVTFPDGSTTEVPAIVDVLEVPLMEADNYTPTPNVQEVPLNSTPDAKGSIGNADQLPEGTAFEYAEGPDTSTPGTKDVIVVVVYPDGSIDEVATAIVVDIPDTTTPITDEFDPVYPRSFVRVGESASSVRPNLTRFVNGREFLRQPLAAAGEVTFTTDDARATLSDDGRVEITAPGDAQPGDFISIPVTVAYEDGSTDMVDAVFEVIAGDYADMYDPKYEVGRNAAPGERVDVLQIGDRDVPEGTTFTLDRDNSNLNGWGIQVDETSGTIRAIAPQSREHRAEVAVIVSYSDGTEETVTALVDPQDDTSLAATTPVQDAMVEIPVGVALDADVLPTLPDRTTVTVGDFSNQDWSVRIDDTGEATVFTTEKVKPNDSVVVPVVLTFPDGSTKTINVTLVAVESQANTVQPKYTGIDLVAGTSGTVKLEKGIEATYSLAGTAAGLRAVIDQATGEIGVSADAGAKTGARSIPVDVRYTDGSVERIEAPVNVTQAQTGTACGSSGSSTSSTSSTSSCAPGSSDSRSVIAIILGLLAAIGGAGWALYINQDAVRDVLRNFGINI